jgi:hypothetical protein
MKKKQDPTMKTEQIGKLRAAIKSTKGFNA